MDFFFFSLSTHLFFPSILRQQEKLTELQLEGELECREKGSSREKSSLARRGPERPDRRPRGRLFNR
jgi:hypothetical protein